jgi:hypothetical protein
MADQGEYERILRLGLTADLLQRVL